MPRGYPGTGPTAGKSKKTAAATTTKAASAAPPAAVDRRWTREDLLTTLDGLERVRDALSERGRLTHAEVTVAIEGRKVTAEFDGNEWKIGL